jgi:translation initiation factor IF-3
MPTQKAVIMAEEMGVDLVLISEKAVPPIAKLIDYGKYQYELKKKAKATASKSHKTETKTLQVKLGTGEHDLELKSKKASEFLGEGHRVKIDLFLRGRAKYLDKNFLETRLDRILHLITEEYRVADGPKKSPKGLTVILERDTKKKSQTEEKDEDKKSTTKET